MKLYPLPVSPLLIMQGADTFLSSFGNDVMWKQFEHTVDGSITNVHLHIIIRLTFILVNTTSHCINTVLAQNMETHGLPLSAFRPLQQRGDNILPNHYSLIRP